MPANRKRESIEAELNAGETDRITKRLRDTLREFEEVEKGNWASSFKSTPDKQRWPALRRLFHRAGVQMNYQAFTNDSLTMMYEGVRGALAADDALKRQELETRFRVRETPEWKQHAADLESEMLKRGMFFQVIDWSEDQGTLPFDKK